jgi:hypothetical protein
MKNKKGNIAYIAVIAVIVVITFAVIGYLFMKNLKNSQKAVAPTVQAPVSQSVTVSNTAQQENAQQGPSGIVPKNYTDEMVQWYDAPKPVSDLNIFKSKDFNATSQAWETGTIKTGDYAGYKLLLVINNPNDPSPDAQIYRFIQKPGDKELEFLKDYSSDDIYSTYGLQAEDKDNGSLSSKTFPYENYAYNLNISSLVYPGIIVSPSGQQLKIEDNFPFDLTGESDSKNPDSYFKGSFFNTDMLKFAFTDPIYGDIYTTDPSKVTDANSDSVFAENGFYVKAPDNTFKAYSAVIDLGGDTPKITWSDGTQNDSKYSYKTESGCGASNYVDDVSNKVSDDALVQLGTASNGDAVYGYKDPNDKALKDFYDEYKTLSGNQDMVPRYYPDDKTKTLTYDQFLQTHPIFFWKDSFGRTIQFINLHYIYSGGCGKPVIYLYPQQTENVSVQVTPTGGMSKSDPAYNGGWNVVADSQSNIFNLGDSKTYPYLFWEGSGDSIYHMPARGFVIAKNDLGGFFDDKLAQEGLIPKESNDFKDFWMPKMLSENKPYYFVTFVDRATIDKLAPLDITPQPDTTIRVLMDYKGLDSPILVQGFDIKTPQRQGFTAVEWGGVLK